MSWSVRLFWATVYGLSFSSVINAVMVFVIQYFMFGTVSFAEYFSVRDSIGWLVDTIFMFSMLASYLINNVIRFPEK